MNIVPRWATAGVLSLTATLAPNVAKAWTSYGACGTSVAGGITPWAIGCKTINTGGSGTWEYTGTTWVQEFSPAAGISIYQDFGATDYVFLINQSHAIYYTIMGILSTWDAADSSKKFQSLAVGTPDTQYDTWATTTDGKVWVNSGGLPVGGSWTNIPLPGGALAKKVAVWSTTSVCNGGISVHEPIVIDTNNNIYYYWVGGGSPCTSGSFALTGGAGVDVTPGFLIGTDGNLYQGACASGGCTWSLSEDQPPAGLRTIGAAGGHLFAIDNEGVIYSE